MMRCYSIKWSGSECLLPELCGDQDVCPQDAPHLLRKKNKLKLRQVPKAAGTQGRWWPVDSRNWRPGRYTLSQGIYIPTQNPTFCQTRHHSIRHFHLHWQCSAMRCRHLLLNPTVWLFQPHLPHCPIYSLQMESLLQLPYFSPGF